jgi:glycerol-3-phosphate dehydrogenase
MMTKEGRHVMMIPWRNHTLIGTTDKEYNGDPDDYKVTKQSILELIDEINSNYGSSKIAYDDVLFAYGGLRPLVDNQTEASYESSRKYEVFDNAKDGLNGLITIEGGKYTTSRRLASNVMKIISKKLNKSLGKSVTDKKYLVDSDITNMESFIRQLVLFYIRIRITKFLFNNTQSSIIEFGFSFISPFKNISVCFSHLIPVN